VREGKPPAGPPEDERSRGLERSVLDVSQCQSPVSGEIDPISELYCVNLEVFIECSHIGIILNEGDFHEYVCLLQNIRHQ
jgi:hypothetical protein